MKLLLDLFCGAGGCAKGYRRAGFFAIVGVDMKPQPNYPFAFVQMDAIKAMEVLLGGGKISTTEGHQFGLDDFHAIHASPPCQRYSTGSKCRADRGASHPDLLPAVQEALDQSGRPWVIENVPQAPFRRRTILCGLMFGLKLYRHRGFETSFALSAPEHPTHAGKRIGKDGMCCVVGHGGGTTAATRRNVKRFGTAQNKTNWEAAMGIDWMTRDELAQAIPPAYTEFVGRQLLAHLVSA